MVDLCFSTRSFDDTFAATVEFRIRNSEFSPEANFGLFAIKEDLEDL
jgi:hypothetical protein